MTALLISTVGALGIALCLLLIVAVAIDLVRDRADAAASWEKGPVAQEAIDLFTDLPEFDWPIERRPFDWATNHHTRSAV